jgi:metal-dependent amidase/aminoacylase/carboxypeptidase family protein
MAIAEAIRQMEAEMREWRRDIHAHPELGFEEERTSGLVAAKLESFGIDVHRGVGRTGVVGVLKSGSSKKSVGLRADMDALPIQETAVVSVTQIHAGDAYNVIPQSARLARKPTSAPSSPRSSTIRRRRSSQP